MTIILLILIITFLFVFKKFDKKSYDLNEVEERFLKYYSDINFESKSNDEMLEYFSIPITNANEALLVGNFNPNLEISEDIEDPNLLFIVTNLEENELNEYYDAMKAFVSSYTEKENDNEALVELYEKSILKKGNNYFYFIIGNNNTVIERELLELYK